jgi:hypothetical protein
MLHLVGLSTHCNITHGTYNVKYAIYVCFLMKVFFGSIYKVRIKVTEFLAHLQFCILPRKLKKYISRMLWLKLRHVTVRVSWESGDVINLRVLYVWHISLKYLKHISCCLYELLNIKHITFFPHSTFVIVTMHC